MKNTDFNSVDQTVDRDLQVTYPRSAQFMAVRKHQHTKILSYCSLNDYSSAGDQ